MKTTFGLAALAAVAILAGCASTDQNAGNATPPSDATAAAAKEGDYVTGSRLPRRGSGDQSGRQ